MTRTRKTFLREQLNRYWFFAGIAAVLLTGLAQPSAGIVLKRWHIPNIGIFLAFFIAGLTLETGHIVDARSNLKALVGSLASSLILFPALTFFLCKIFFARHIDFEVGSLIIAVAPVTVASGTVMTAMAGGNIPLSLFICIAGNVIAIFTIPFSLNLLMHFGAEINLPALNLIQSLFYTAIIPIVAGQLARLRLKDAIVPYHKVFSFFSQLVVLLIIFNVVAASGNRLVAARMEILLVVVFMSALHLLVLVLNFGLTRLLHLDKPSTAAFTIHTSQKTVTISYVVWAGYFAATFPMAMIPGISYHLIQVIADTFVAHRLRIAK